MVDNVLFGNKVSFAIELGYSKNPKKFYLRFWIQSLSMGSFKKSDVLRFSIETFKKIQEDKERMFLPIFNGMTTAEIYNYTKVNYNNEEDLKKLDELVQLYKLAFFGIQFTDTQSEYLILYKDQILQFIWKNDYNKPLFEAKVSFDEFCLVFNQYINYCYEKGLA